MSVCSTTEVREGDDLSHVTQPEQTQGAGLGYSMPCSPRGLKGGVGWNEV